jgi:hypothetical protein
MTRIFAGAVVVTALTIAVLTAHAGAAQATPSRPAGLLKAEYRALMLRSEALDQKYGLHDQRAVPAGMTHAEYRALMLRSEALNEKYGLGAHRAPAATTQASRSPESFAWEAFGIGAVAMFGFVLLISGVLLVGSRSGRARAYS